MKNKLVFMFLFSVIPFCAFAQDGIPSDGREYFIGFVLPSFNRQVVSDPSLQQHFRVSLLISAFSKAVVTISYYSDNGAELIDHSIQIAAHGSVTLPLDLTKLLGDTIGDIATYHTCHVVSTGAISVQCYSSGVCSGGSYLALPPQCWGKEYVVMSYHDNPDGVGGVVSNERSRGFFQIVAGENATEVEIIPTSRTAGGHEGIYFGDGATGILKPYSISLNRGQSYTVFSDGSSSESDISGSRVSASKPIGVIAGHENAFSDDSYIEPYIVDERNFMIQQLIPVECWDTASSTTPLYEKAVDPGNQFRLFFGKGHKSSKISGTVNILSIKQKMNIGKYQSPLCSKQLSVSSLWLSNDSRFGLMQYNHRRQSPIGLNPTPSMMNVIPDQCWKRYYAFVVPKSNPSQEQSNYINIIWNENELQYIWVSFNGGQSIPITAAANLQKTNKSGYGTNGYIFRVQPGTYVITSWAPFALYNYGFQSVTISNTQHSFSHASPAGMVYKQRDLPPSDMTVDYETNCDIWKVTVHSKTKENGIRYISIDSGSMAFDENIDPLRKGEVLLSGQDTIYSFMLHRVDLGNNSTCSLSFYDCSGKRIGFGLGFNPNWFKIIHGTTDYRGAKNLLDSVLLFPKTVCGKLATDSVKFYYGDKDYFWFSDPRTVWVNSVTISDTSEFKVSLIAEGPYRSLPTKVGYLKLKIEFSPRYTGIRKGVIRIETCAGVIFLNMQGEGQGVDPSELLIATDAVFNTTDTGQSSCKPILITNNTTEIVTLLPHPEISDTTVFSLDQNYFLKYFPIQLMPGASIEMLAWFHPHSAATSLVRIHWLTDLPKEMEAVSKTTSLLRGTGQIGKKLRVEEEPQALSNTLQFGGKTINDYSVYDLLGRLIFQSDRINADKIVFPKMPIGIYIIHIEFENGDRMSRRMRLP